MVSFLSSEVSYPNKIQYYHASEIVLVQIFVCNHRKQIPTNITIRKVSFDELYAVNTNAICLVVDNHIVEDFHRGLIHPESQNHVFKHFETLMTHAPTSAFIQFRKQRTKVNVEMFRLNSALNTFSCLQNYFTRIIFTVSGLPLTNLLRKSTINSSLYSSMSRSMIFLAMVSI